MKKINKNAINSFIIPLIWTVLTIPIFALPPGIQLDQYIVDKWEGRTGFQTDTVNALAQTGDGYIWVGTDKGLFRFDSVNFQRIPLDTPGKPGSNRVSSLLVDNQGILWVGHSRGISQIQEGKSAHFLNWENLAPVPVSALCSDVKGDLWVGTAFNYLVRLAGKEIHRYNQEQGLSGKFITAVMEDSRGFVWAASLTSGLFRLQYGNFSQVEIPGLHNKHSIHTLYEDRDGILWIGTNMGLFRKNGDEVDIFTTGEGLSDNRVNTIHEDSDNNLWVGTVSGLNRIRQKSAKKLTMETLFPNLFVSAILEDREKSLWIGTNGGALKRLRERIFSGYSSPQGLAPFISTVHQEKDGTLWFGSDYGKLFYRQGKGFKEFNFNEGILDFRIRTLGSDRQGNVLVGTSRYGIFKILDREKNRYSVIPGFEDTIIQSLFTDSRGNLWIGTMGKGLTRSRDGSSLNYTIRDGLLSNVILDISEDKSGNIWVASTNGLNRLPGGKIKTIESFLPGTFTLSVHQDTRGTLWAGTLSKGLGRFESGSWQFLTKDDGLDSNAVFQVLEDKQLHFWMSSSGGVMRISREEALRYFKNPKGKIACTTYGLSDGMNGPECNGWGKNAGIRTHEGEFWFPTKQGASRVIPGRLSIKKLPAPRVIIQEIRINGQAIDSEEALKVTHRGNIEIFFTANTFIALERVKFTYHLQGDQDSIQKTVTSRKRSVKYSNLPPGSYRFSVSAVNSDGVAGLDNPQVNFVVTSKASTLVFAGALASIFLFFLLLGYIIKKRFGHKRLLSKKYQSSNLDEKKAEIDIQKLQYLLEIEKLYRDESVSLSSLADRLDLTYHQLSQLINERLNKNFYDLINTYRIDEAKSLLAGPKESRRSVLAIAFEVGFNTKAAFNRVFKKYTGMTPSQYRQKHTR